MIVAHNPRIQKCPLQWLSAGFATYKRTERRSANRKTATTTLLGTRVRYGRIDYNWNRYSATGNAALKFLESHVCGASSLNEPGYNLNIEYPARYEWFPKQIRYGPTLPSRSGHPRPRQGSPDAPGAKIRALAS